MSLSSSSNTAANCAPPEQPPGTLADIVRAHRGGVLVSALGAVIGAACGLAPYLAIYAVTVALFVDRNPAAVGTIVVWTAGALLLRGLAQALAGHSGHVAAYRILKDVRLAIGHKLRTLPLGRVQARSAGEWKKILHDDVEQLEEALAHGIPDGAAAAAVPLATTVALFVIDWRLALVALGALVGLIIVSAIAIRFAQRNNAATVAHMLPFNRAVMGYLQGIKIIRGYQESGHSRARAAVLRSAELEHAATDGPQRWLVAVMTVATAGAVAFLVPVGGLGLLNGNFDLATVVLFGILGLGYLTPVIGLVATLAMIVTRVQYAASAISEILAEEELPEPATPLVPTTFEVTFDDVGFGYREDRQILRGINIQVPDGSSLALVGATGSGKSTLARLLARFYDTQQGRISVGGVDVRDIAPANLARLVAFIQQDEYVFETSLLENVRLARPSATDAEVRQAAQRAQLGDVVDTLAEGWHTVLAGGGSQLSGGQRQRIAIARAMLKDAPIVVLDEATAALDAATEGRTLAAIAELTRGRTVIAIAHRLATIVDADTIAFMDDGQITATGSHQQLLDCYQPYRELWAAYTRADGWRLSVAAQPASINAGSGPVDRDCAETAVEPSPMRDLECPGLDEMGFFRQWRTLYGRSWAQLLRRGLVRLVCESALRGAPLIAVLMLMMAAVGASPSLRLDAPLVWSITAGLWICLIVRVAALAWSNRLNWRLASNAKADLQLSILDRLRRVPLGFFQRIDQGRLSTLVTSDVALIDFQNIPGQVMGTLIQPVIAGTALVIIDWRLAVAALAGVPVFLALTTWSDRIYRRVFVDLHTARHQATSVMVEQARGAAALRANPNSAIAGQFDLAVSRLAETSIAMSVKATPATTLGSIAVESGQVLLIAVGASLYASGSLTAAPLLFFLLLSVAIYQPITELTALAGYRRSQQQIARRVGEVWDAPVLVEPVQPTRLVGAAVELADVSFSYTEDGSPTLTKVSLRAEPGQVTALVGCSGSGKSTIANLISRLWEVDAGAVMIGGIDLRELGSSGVFSAVSTVYQDVYLFEDTVRFNLTLGRDGISDDQLWQALRAAQCGDVVAALAQQLDTVLADGGTDLSGGQRQRLAIARALLKDSPVLILDEAVAAVDPATEDQIQRALSTLAAGRTVIVIAHRIRTICEADQIVVVDAGSIAGSGTHEELLAGCPQYRQLAHAQGIGHEVSSK